MQNPLRGNSLVTRQNMRPTAPTRDNHELDIIRVIPTSYLGLNALSLLFVQVDLLQTRLLKKPRHSAWAVRQASQMSGRSLPRSGTVRPMARAQARTSAVEGSSGAGAWSSSVVAPATPGGVSLAMAACSVSAQAWAAARNR